MRNEFELGEKYVTIFLDRRDGDKVEAKVDYMDLMELLMFDVKWSAIWSETTQSFYVVAKHYVDGERKYTYLHRFIMKPDDDKVVDHVTHDTLDNRRCNLKVTTRSENGQNRKGAMKNSKSGIRGINWYSRDSKWLARIQINGKRVTVGYFDDLDEAIEAYNKKKKELTDCP